jgi:Fe-S-cluster containining protein
MSSNLLPILREHGAPMSLCAICPVPGACCRGFTLSYLDKNEDESSRQAPTFWLDTWMQDAQAWVDERDLPFFPSRIDETLYAEDTGRAYVSVRFDCVCLRPDGRCGIYETRPKLCRQYVPLQDELCKFPR